MTGRGISREELTALAAGGTDAHRFWTGSNSRADRFGEDLLVSAPEQQSGPAMESVADLQRSLGFNARRIFFRNLVKQPGESDKPVLVSGPADLPADRIVRERGLQFEVDFAAGYSVGLFCDQRLNREFLESLAPGRVLNCFAYTCAFSVAAARAGAATLDIDLSKKSLERGARNFALNGFERGDHRRIADDVFRVLPRLARRGERFDAIVLDPPTFSRGNAKRVFRVQDDLAELVVLAAALLAPGGWMLVSTNDTHSTPQDLSDVVAPAIRTAAIRTIGLPPEIPAGCGASSVWVQTPAV